MVAEVAAVDDVEHVEAAAEAADAKIVTARHAIPSMQKLPGSGRSQSRLCRVALDENLTAEMTIASP